MSPRVSWADNLLLASIPFHNQTPGEGVTG